MKNKKGLSGVITAVILIALVIVATTIVWVMVQNLVTTELEKASSCLEVADKVKLNRAYTCRVPSNTYYATDGSPLEVLQIEVDVKDIVLEEILLSVGGGGETRSITIIDGEVHPDTTMKLDPFEVPGESILKIPETNSGLTYYIVASELNNKEFLKKSNEVKVSVIVNEDNCGISDNMQLEVCSGDNIINKPTVIDDDPEDTEDPSITTFLVMPGSLDSGSVITLEGLYAPWIVASDNDKIKSYSISIDASKGGNLAICEETDFDSAFLETSDCNFMVEEGQEEIQIKVTLEDYSGNSYQETKLFSAIGK